MRFCQLLLLFVAILMIKISSSGGIAHRDLISDLLFLLFIPNVSDLEGDIICPIVFSPLSFAQSLLMRFHAFLFELLRLCILDILSTFGL